MNTSPGLLSPRWPACTGSKAKLAPNGTMIAISKIPGSTAER